MDSTTIECPHCARRVPASDINIDEMVAKCSTCNHVFRFSLDDDRSESRENEPEPAIPTGLKVEQGYGGEFRIRRSWFSAQLYFLLFFCIAWDSFLVFWYAMALGIGNNGQGGGFEWIAIIFPIAHVAVGVGLTYYVAAGFLNSTIIQLDQSMLSVRHGPIPWRGVTGVPVMEISRIEVDFASSNSGTHSYAVSANREGNQVVLLSSLPRKQAHYIGWQLGRQLDVPYEDPDDPPAEGRRYWNPS